MKNGNWREKTNADKTEVTRKTRMKSRTGEKENDNRTQDKIRSGNKHDRKRKSESCCEKTRVT